MTIAPKNLASFASAGTGGGSISSQPIRPAKPAQPAAPSSAVVRDRRGLTRPSQSTEGKKGISAPPGQDGCKFRLWNGLRQQLDCALIPFFRPAHYGQHVRMFEGEWITSAHKGQNVGAIKWVSARRLRPDLLDANNAFLMAYILSRRHKRRRK